MVVVEAFDVLGDPVRRRILQLLASGERTAGEVAGAIQAEFGLTQPAVSRHLRVLRESGFATVRSMGTRRLYALEAAGFEDVEEWLADLPAVDAAPGRAGHRARPRTPPAPTNARRPDRTT